MSKSSQSAAGGSPSKPSTRSSIRLSLGFASKALADVINKDSRDTDKSARKAKENSSRRHSGIALKPAAPRASMGDVKPPIHPVKRIHTPESKTVTRRRVSAGLGRVSMDEQSSGTSETGVRTLRSRTSGSGLPKYRPKSTIVQSTKSPSPTTGSRRPFSSYEDKEDRLAEKEKTVSPSEKASRPISPLPQRAALKSNARTLNATPPPSTPSKVPKPSTTPVRTSPTRPAKLAKVATPTSALASAIPRPTSASPSCSPSRTPTCTPTKASGVKNTPATRFAAHDKNARASPSPHFTRNESPLVRHWGADSRSDSPSGPGDVGNMSHISEGDSEDSEVEDVALLLAPVASLAAPTPAMPRIQTTRTRKRLPPQTPTRANFLPTRANMSYLSPIPPDAEASSFLRPPQQPKDKQRGSILSWEQLASEASKTLGEDEIENMLSDFPAPFQADVLSPTPSIAQLDVPESPCLSAMSSPGGYGSISQVLLPDVTPSPALHHRQLSRFDISPETSAGDAAAVTLLRLQLAAAENMAKERLAQMQSMEKEIHDLKQSRGRETLHLSEQIAILEQQLKNNLEMRERADEERALYTRGLEDQLRQEQTMRDRAVKNAVVRGQELARAELDAALKPERDSLVLASSARIAALEWKSVRGLAELELDVVREEMQVLSLLLAELFQSPLKL
ncbi:hypothetical protein C0993_001244 [Termitomyces sp. T159_Od127]|nr:hypothetical protein C0993_001244 [Termitomyces sp. T159_Od127]